jgi:hypothetical protein
MNLWFMTAGVLSIICVSLHIFLGGRLAARPLLDSNDLGRTAKYTNYYCWHLVTISIAVMGVMFFWAGLGAAWELALVASILAGLFSLWSIGIVIINKGRLWVFPQWALFAPIVVLGFKGLL